jgi:hypothetical protein
MQQRQLKLPMLTYVDGPVLVDERLVRACGSYREAVRQCWEHRTRRNLKRATLAEDVGLHPPHVTDYLHADNTRRDLPAKYVEAFEVSCGNRFITQWFAWRANCTLTDQLQRAA